MNKEQAYADRTIAAYRWRAKEAIANWSTHKPSKFLREFVRQMKAVCPSTGSGRTVPRVLDYGCGVGTELAWMLRNRLQAEGMDGTLEFVSEARRRCPGAPIRFARFERMDLPAGAYDGIWCNAALIHVPPTVFRRQLEKVRAGLRPSGLLGLTLAWGRTKGFTRGDWISGRYCASYTKTEVEPFFAGWTIRQINVVSNNSRKGRWIEILAVA